VRAGKRGEPTATERSEPKPHKSVIHRVPIARQQTDLFGAVGELDRGVVPDEQLLGHLARSGR
jgi:hypothetical protein